MPSDDLCVRCGLAEAQPILSGSDRLYGTTAEQFQIVRCRSCGMMRLSPRPAASELARYYPEGYWYSAGGLAEAYRRLVLRDHIGFVLRAYSDAGNSGRILDVGCGGGLLAAQLRRRALPAFGLDSSPQACRIASQKHGVTCATGLFDKTNPFRSAAFRLITMFHLLEHLPDPQAYLGAAHSALDAQGQLIVQVPNAACWQFRFLGHRWNGLDIPRHLHHFRLGDIGFVLEKSGFRVVRVKHFSWRDNPAGLATSLAPSLDPVARGVRGKPTRLWTLAAYLALNLGSFWITALEALFRRGSTVMIQARKL